MTVRSADMLALTCELKGVTTLFQLQLSQSCQYSNAPQGACPAELGSSAVTQRAKACWHKQHKPSCSSVVQMHDMSIEQMTLLAVVTAMLRCTSPCHLFLQNLFCTQIVLLAAFMVTLQCTSSAICFGTSSVATASPCEEACLHQRNVIWLSVCTKQTQFWLRNSSQQWGQ